MLLVASPPRIKEGSAINFPLRPISQDREDLQDLPPTIIQTTLILTMILTLTLIRIPVGLAPANDILSSYLDTERIWPRGRVDGGYAGPRDSHPYQRFRLLSQELPRILICNSGMLQVRS